MLGEVALLSFMLIGSGTAIFCLELIWQKRFHFVTLKMTLQAQEEHTGKTGYLHIEMLKVYKHKTTGPLQV